MCADYMPTDDLTGSTCPAFLHLVCTEDQLMTVNYANLVLGQPSLMVECVDMMKLSLRGVCVRVHECMVCVVRVCVRAPALYSACMCACMCMCVMLVVCERACVCVCVCVCVIRERRR